MKIKFFLNNHFWILIFALSALVVWPLFMPGYFSHHDNLQAMRIFEMRKCFADFQIPCRWVPDMGYGNGYPLFNFYGPLSYYLGAVVSFILGYIWSAKLLFFLPLVVGGLGMYLLGRELFGKIPGAVSAILYLFAPYRALDSYVRGAVGESFALAIIPFVYYLYLRLIKTKEKKYFALAIVSMSLLLVSHNIMTLIFTPLIIIWVFFLLYRDKWNGLKIAILSLGLAVGLSAFFILPAFLEKSLVQTEALTRNELDFRAQFVKVSQLFIDRSWNYSGSQPQSANTISYQIGWPHWWLVVLSLVAVIFCKKRKDIALFTFYFLLFTFGVYMTHNKSSFIWEYIKILAYIQFPWRFLSVVILSSSLLGGYFIFIFKGKVRYLFAITFSLLAILLNWQYFKPEHFYFNLTDKELLSGQNFIDQQKGALLDYLPKTALEPRELAPDAPYVVSGKAEIFDFINKSNRWTFKTDAVSESKVEIPVFDFPGWTVFVNGKEVVHTNDNVLGRIGVTIPGGKSNVEGKFKNTPIRILGNTLTGLSFVLLVLIYAKGKKLFS
ncbi:MAG: glycosyltransferase family 39 protein [Candidatus Woesebacteria bacterium]|nr:MAG: glycosyltransferase family 39 protein [Candidatus Woesebacteria bacterium]